MVINETQSLEGKLQQTEKIQGKIQSKNAIKGANINVGIVTEKDYNKLINKPQINDVTLIGNRSLKELDIQETMYSLTNLEIESIIGD